MTPELRSLLSQAASLALAPACALWRRPWISVLALLAVVALSPTFHLGVQWLSAAAALVALAYSLPHSRSSR